MKVVAVNVSPIRRVEREDRTVTTGIFKSRVEGRIRVRKLGLEGDAQADLRVHGGLDKAVYAYPFEHYSHWETELNQGPYPTGQFGENLTTEGLAEESVFIGDVYRFGETVLQVSEPREPCFKLALRMGSARFPKVFLASGRVGFYLRVIEEGEVWEGAAIERIDRDPREVPIRAMVRLLTTGPREKGLMLKALEIPSLSPRIRAKLNQWLAEEASGWVRLGEQ